MMNDDGNIAVFSNNLRGIGVIRESKDQAMEAITRELRLEILRHQNNGCEVPWKEEKWFNGSGYRTNVMVSVSE